MFFKIAPGVKILTHHFVLKNCLVLPFQTRIFQWLNSFLAENVLHFPNEFWHFPQCKTEFCFCWYFPSFSQPPCDLIYLSESVFYFQQLYWIILSHFYLWIKVEDLFNCCDLNILRKIHLFLLSKSAHIHTETAIFRVLHKALICSLLLSAFGLHK